MADSLHAGDTTIAEQVLDAAERYREANRQFSALVEQLRPPTSAGEQARIRLLEQLSRQERGDELLRRMLDASDPSQSEIHTPTPPDQVQ